MTSFGAYFNAFDVVH